MTWSRIAIALVLTSSMAYAQQPPTPMQQPPAPAVMTPNEVGRFLAFFDALVAAVVRDSQSCGQMAADVSALIDSNHDNLEAVRTARIAHKRMPQQAQYHVLDGIRRMGPGIENCSENAKVKAAFEKLDDHAGL